jgi:hypothetical protein
MQNHKFFPFIANCTLTIDHRFFKLPSRMVTLMNLLQSLSGHMGIYLSAGDIRMAEHHLDRTKIRPPFQKMAGKGVAKKVGGDPLTKSSSSRIIFKIFP